MQESRTPDLKRKRTSSNPNSPNPPKENSFLYQKILDLTKELDAQRIRNTSLQVNQISRQNLPPQYLAPGLPGQFPRQNLTGQTSRQSPAGFYMVHPSTAGQAHPKDNMTGQAHPTANVSLPVPGWGLHMGPNMSQWSAGQEFFPLNQ